MNKKLITLALLSLTSCTAMAEDSKIYLKLGAGINGLIPHNFDGKEYTGKVKLAHTYPLFKVGIGYQCSDSIRTELVLNHHFMFNSHERSYDKDGDLYKIVYKTKINTLMANAYKDIMTIGYYTPFIGGGIGISNIKEKATGVVTKADRDRTYGLDDVTTKKVNRMNFKLTAGVDIKLADNIKAELAYNYFNLGYNKPKVIDGSQVSAKRAYKVHNITASIRYSL